MRACVVVVGLALLALVAARCPNSCSGHGDCGASDVCTCWANFQGYDCSERTCAYDIAWATNYRQDAHYYAECSNAGICDRATGECVCFDGFTGVACKRTVCPNDCSGHGKCRLVSELPEATQAQYINPLDAGGVSGGLVADGFPSDDLELPGSVYPYYNWDGDKIQACLCDGEFFGPDCSLRHCPTGDDPLTTCPEQIISGGTESPAYDKHQVQKLTITSSGTAGSGPANLYTSGVLTGSAAQTGALVLHYTDSQGQVWTTSAITLGASATATSSAIISALTALPNYKIPSITVSGSDGTTSNSWLITFTDERTSGDQELLACDPLPLGCVTAGCSPFYQQPLYTHFSALVGSVPGGASSITADSIFDNSNMAVDQAVFVVVVKYGAIGDLYPSYFVDWDYSTAGASFATTYASAATITLPGCVSAKDMNTCQFKYVPSGLVGGDANHNPMPSGVNNKANENGVDSGTLANGVGFNHIPVGNGLYVQLPDAYAGLGASVNTAPSTAKYAVLKFTVATVRCSVVEYLRSDPMFENEECSGRGTCDYTTGTCNCYEGQYGDHCHLQTILV